MKPIVISGPSGGEKAPLLLKQWKHIRILLLLLFHIQLENHDLERLMEKVTGFFVVDIEFVLLMLVDNSPPRIGIIIICLDQKKALEDVSKTGRICILDVELQGVRSIHKCKLDAKYILIRTPSLKILEDRLRARKTETEESLKKE
ncbi:Guanylate kinase [Dirofilaria immitis]|nr:Guanylate kinase [Dirofilaria immitis]